MNDLKPILSQLYKNLNILSEREAKYAGNAPLDLLNQIDDHKKAITFTERAIKGEITEDEWRKETEALLAFTEGQVVKIEIKADTLIIGDQHLHLAPESGPSPPNTRFWRWAVAIGILITIIAGITQITGINMQDVESLFTPAPFSSATDDETLIVIATFHETSATHTEPHVKIKRAIEDAAKDVGLDSVRVEIDPTVLTADQREEAEALGRQYNASIVVWGEDTGVEVIVNYLNLKEPDFMATQVKITETERVQLANPSAYAGFITTELPAQLTFLSLFAVGQSYYVQEEYTEAVRIIEKAVVSLPLGMSPLEGASDAYFRLGWLYQEPTIGNLEQAIANYTKAIDLNPDYTKAYYNRGNAYDNSGDLEQAIADYTKAIDLNPDLAAAYHNRGHTYYNSGDLEQAIADYTKAIDRNPDYVLAYTSRGLAYDDSGDLEQAIADHTKAIDLKPDYAVAYYNRGNAYYDSGDLEQAIADYTKALDLNPDLAVAYTNRGLAYDDSGNLEQAIVDHTKAIDLDPDLAVAYYNRGNAYHDSGDLEQAIADYTKAIDLDPDLAVAYYNRGNAYKNSGDLEQAITDFTKVIDLNPDFAEVYNNRGIAYYDSGDLEQAIADFTKAVDLNLDFAEVYTNRGIAYYDSGDLEQAIADFERYLELVPNASNREAVLNVIKKLKAELGQ